MGQHSLECVLRGGICCGDKRWQRTANHLALVTRAWRAGPSPAGDGEEGFAITQVLVWLLVRWTAPLRWPRSFGPRFFAAAIASLRWRVARSHAERKTDAVFEDPFYALRGWGIFLPIPAGMGQHSSECVLRGGNCCGDEYWQHTANRLAPVTRARRAGPSPAGDGEEGFAITQVLVWPLLWCAAPLRWPLFGTAFHSAVPPRLCSARLRFAGCRTLARRFLRPHCDARMARWAVPRRGRRGRLQNCWIGIWLFLRCAAALRWLRGAVLRRAENGCGFRSPFLRVTRMGIFLLVPEGTGQHTLECVLCGAVCCGVKVCHARRIVCRL